MNTIKTTFWIGAAAAGLIGLFAMQSSLASAHCPAENRSDCIEPERKVDRGRDSTRRSNRTYRYYGEGLGYWLVNQPGSMPGIY